MQGTFYICNSQETYENALKEIDAKFKEIGWVKIQINDGKINKRSLPQSDLFHVWCREAGKFFKFETEGDIKPEDKAKYVFKSMFLGYEDIVISGKMTIERQLRHTADLGHGEMHHFMSQIQEWCATKGLPLVSTGEYQMLQEAQNE